MRHILRTLAPLAALLLIAASSAEVKTAQTGLAARGLYDGAIDGKWGKQSSAAVQLFQRRNGLEPTGQLDAETQRALEAAVEKPALPVKASAQERARRAASTPLAAPPPGPPSAGAIAAADAQKFVERYANATEQAVLDEALAYFAMKVDYLDLGKVDLRTVKSDQRRYYSDWPVRQYEIVGPVEVIRSDAAAATVRYRMRFSIGGASRKDQGISETIIELKKIPGGLAIASIHERRLPPAEDVPGV